MRKEPRTTHGAATSAPARSATGLRATAPGHDDDLAADFRTTSTYLLPLDAHVSLRLIRDELRLLATLAEPRSEDDRDEIVLSTEALSDCFRRIAGELDEVMREVQKVC